jgi:hypothetical protein
MSTAKTQRGVNIRVDIGLQTMELCVNTSYMMRVEGFGDSVIDYFNFLNVFKVYNGKSA